MCYFPFSLQTAKLLFSFTNAKKKRQKEKAIFTIHILTLRTEKKEKKRTAQTKNLRIFAGSNVKNIQKQI